VAASARVKNASTCASPSSAAGGSRGSTDETKGVIPESAPLILTGRSSDGRPSVTTGSASCSACQPGDPAAGNFTLSLPTITTYHPDACRIKTMSGPIPGFSLPADHEPGQCCACDLGM